MNYLIDTNIISEVRKGERCDANVAAWYERIDDADLYLSVLVLGEIRKGIERARPKEPARAKALEKWLAEVREAFQGRILPVDDAVAEEWGRMAGGRSIPTIDGLLAATAKVHRMTLATRNLADVDGLGAKLVNPFEAVKAHR
ncbi:MAG: type II toxin-antitoxin system VapC family toxin [Alphaproteobacteria bacterium]|nr:type II toxin-antitoxin system VapC family toxin [Alphaproteobacteria bacterium]